MLLNGTSAQYRLFSAINDRMLEVETGAKILELGGLDPRKYAGGQSIF